MESRERLAQVTWETCCKMWKVNEENTLLKKSVKITNN